MLINEMFCNAKKYIIREGFLCVYCLTDTHQKKKKISDDSIKVGLEWEEIKGYCSYERKKQNQNII